jgi:hypothetical protein
MTNQTDTTRTECRTCRWFRWTASAGILAVLVLWLGERFWG